MHSNSKTHNSIPLSHCPRVNNHQLQCSGRGGTYPDQAIASYVEDNKALLRRMFGVIVGTEEKSRTVKKTTIRIVRTFGPEKY